MFLLHFIPTCNNTTHFVTQCSVNQRHTFNAFLKSFRVCCGQTLRFKNLYISGNMLTATEKAQSAEPKCPSC